MNDEINRLDKQIRRLSRILKASFVIAIFFAGFLLGFIGFNIAPFMIERPTSMLILETGQETTNWNNMSFTEEDNGKFLVFSWENLDANKFYLLQWTLFDDDFDAWVLSTLYTINDKTNYTTTIEVQKSHYLLSYFNGSELVPVVSVALYEEVQTIDLIKAIPRLGGIDVVSMAIGMGIGLVIDLMFIIFGYSAKKKLMEKVRFFKRNNHDNNT